MKLNPTLQETSKSFILKHYIEKRAKSNHVFSWSEARIGNRGLNMRRKIQDMIQGKFEYNRPALVVREEELRFSVIEDEDYSGSFHLMSSSQVPIRGIVTCENPHIRILTTEFDGLSAEIRFEFLASQASEGDVESGYFVLTSSAGEYLLEFQAQITRHYLPSSIGRIKTLNDFTNLSNLNWDEALTIFKSPAFCNIFHDDAQYFTLLYRGLTERRCTSHEMEEFLIASGKKKRSVFSVDENRKHYVIKKASVSDTIKVMKSEWGYCNIRISCDAAFVSLGKKQLQMYDFRGKHTEFSYQIIPRLMHRGKNYAVITLENCFQKTQIVISAVLGSVYTRTDAPGTEEQEHSLAWKKRYLYFKLEQSFLDFLLENKSGIEWKRESLALLEKAMEAEPDDRWISLWKAYIYIKTKDEKAAEDQLLLLPRSVRNARMPQSAFYAYLTSMADSGSDKKEMIAKVKEIQLKYQHHPVLNWILFQADESLNRNPQRKYQTIKRYMTEYSISPLFYLEAARILQKHPEVLSSQDDFDYHLISWMGKKNLLTPELSLRIQGMAQGRRSFSRSYLRVLSKCYKKYGDEGIVKTICVYLIKTSRYGETYFPWFKRGIEQHLKIAGLYEAYMLSWSRSLGELPAEVVKYFSMSSSLPSKRKAMLFAYIVRNKHRLGKDWSSYMVMVKNFAVKELEKGHISDDLAIIYEEIRRMLGADEWNRIKKEAESCYKIHTRGEAVCTVRVLQNVPETMRQRAAINNDSAYIYLYRKPYVILYEDSNAVLYTTKDGCRMSKMLSGGSIYAPDPDQPVPKTEEIVSRKRNDEKKRLDQMAGSIDEMTALILNAANQKRSVLSYAQQLMIRMLFTGYLPEKHNEIFQLLLPDRDSEELLIAYVTFLSRSMLLNEYPIHESVYFFMAEKLYSGKRLNQYCDAAFLCMYLRQGGTKYDLIAEQILKKYLFSGKYFDFFTDLSPELKRKYFLLDMHVVSYHGTPGKAFYIEFAKGGKESMNEVLPGLYTYALRILPGETCEYTVVDIKGSAECGGKLQVAEISEAFEDTRYGKLAGLSEERTDTKAQYAYAELCDMVNTLFIPVKE